MKNVLVIIIVLVLLGIATFLFFHYRDSILAPKEKVAEQTTQPQAPTITIENKTIKDSTKPFSIDIAYPFIGSLVDFNQKIQTIINKEIDEFKANSLANDKTVQETDPQGYANYPREYDLKMTYTKGEVDQNTVSVIFAVSNFTGGAHGANYFIPFNYDVKNSKEIALADLFPNQTNYLQKISDYCTKDLNQQIATRLGSAEGTWVKDGANPKAENFSSFLINKDTIVFYFPQYQVAPYAAGDFKVTMPR